MDFLSPATFEKQNVYVGVAESVTETFLFGLQSVNLI